MRDTTSCEFSCVLSWSRTSFDARRVSKAGATPSGSAGLNCGLGLLDGGPCSERIRYAGMGRLWVLVASP